MSDNDAKKKLKNLFMGTSLDGYIEASRTITLTELQEPDRCSCGATEGYHCLNCHITIADVKDIFDSK